jgi:hypothetical protein
MIKTPAPPEKKQRQAGGSLFGLGINPNLAVSQKLKAIRSAVSKITAGGASHRPAVRKDCVGCA